MAIKTAPEQRHLTDDSIWRNFRTKLLLRQTQIYAHASFLRRKKGVTDSQFHAVSKVSEKPLVLSWENVQFLPFEVESQSEEGGPGIFLGAFEIDGVWQLSAYKRPWNVIFQAPKKK